MKKKKGFSMSADMFIAPLGKAVNGSFCPDYRRYETPSYLRLGKHGRFIGGKLPKIRLVSAGCG